MAVPRITSRPPSSRRWRMNSSGRRLAQTTPNDRRRRRQKTENKSCQIKSRGAGLCDIKVVVQPNSSGSDYRETATGAILLSELHARERERTAAVRALHVVDCEPEPQLDHIAELAATLCNVPYGAVSIIDADRHYTVASHGSPRVHATRADSLCALAILQNAPLISANATDDPRFAHKAFLRMVNPPIRLFAAAPIIATDHLPVGTVRVYGEDVGELTSAQVIGLQRLADMAMSVLALRSRSLTMRQLAIEDSLTGLPNRRALDSMISPDDFSHADFAALAFIDLDAFKSINDRWGHAAGDAVLQASARRIESISNAEDVVIRIGGDEFIVLFRNAVEPSEITEATARAFAEPIATQAGDIQISASVGVVSVSSADTLDSLIDRADALMYTAKRGNLTG